MSRTFTDDNFLTWEAYTSGGDFGLPDQPHIIFNCLTEPGARPRYVVHDGDEADAGEFVQDAGDAELKALLGKSRPVD
jgi:hypothetical protein